VLQDKFGDKLGFWLWALGLELELGRESTDGGLDQ
jgi:hypothetical protein